MNVASLELCKELYEVSGWEGGEFLWACAEQGQHFPRLQHFKTMHIDTCMNTPAYDLSYLLRKLEDKEGFRLDRCVHIDYSRNWCASVDDGGRGNAFAYGDTPEDAACKLAIELFKQGVVTK